MMPFPMALRLLRLATITACGVVTLGCSDPSPPVPATILIEPSNPTVPQGLSVQLHATVLDREGRSLPPENVGFSTPYDVQLTVDSTGLVQAVSSWGFYAIRVAAGSVDTIVYIEVTRRFVGIKVQPESLLMEPRTTTLLEASLKDFTGLGVNPDTPIRFKSLDTSLVSVVGRLVTAGAKSGSTAIRVTIDSFQHDVPVRVGQAVSIRALPRSSATR